MHQTLVHFSKCSVQHEVLLASADMCVYMCIIICKCLYVLFPLQALQPPKSLASLVSSQIDEDAAPVHPAEATTLRPTESHDSIGAITSHLRRRVQVAYHL